MLENVPKSYRGWNIWFDPHPIMSVDMWTATSPDYDVDCDQDGFYVCSGHSVRAETYTELCAEIDGYIDE